MADIVDIETDRYLQKADEIVNTDASKKIGQDSDYVDDMNDSLKIEGSANQPK